MPVGHAKAAAVDAIAGEARPHERLRTYGAQSLRDAELLAVILRAGAPGLSAEQLAQRLLLEHSGWPGLLHLGIDQLTDTYGMGVAKATSVKAALEVGRRLILHQPHQRPHIAGPADVANLVMIEMSHFEQEHLRVVLLNSKNLVLRIEDVYVGTINSSNVRIGEVFKAAIRANAVALIVLHNHPSGDPAPSPEDVAVTRQLAQAGKLLDVELLDHLIIGDGRWISLREKRLGFGA